MYTKLQMKDWSLVVSKEERDEQAGDGKVGPWTEYRRPWIEQAGWNPLYEEKQMEIHL